MIDILRIEQGEHYTTYHGELVIKHIDGEQLEVRYLLWDIVDNKPVYEDVTLTAPQLWQAVSKFSCIHYDGFDIIKKGV